MSELEKSKLQDMAGRAMGAEKTEVAWEPTKESTEQSIQETKQELEVVENLKKAIIGYLLIDDYMEYDDNESAYCLLMGRLEMSIIRRKQALIDDNKKWMELA